MPLFMVNTEDKLSIFWLVFGSSPFISIQNAVLSSSLQVTFTHKNAKKPKMILSHKRV